MSIKALTALSAFWYTPIDQRDAAEDPEKPVSEDNPLVVIEDPAEFKLKALMGPAFMEVAAHGETLLDGTFMPDHVGRMLLLKGGLNGWRNVEDPAKGGQLKFSRRNFEFIPSPYLVECTNEIFQASALGADVRKNS